jgi:hypothetical protein
VPSSSSIKENRSDICKQIQQLDNSIRFVGIANNLGSLIATSYRNGLTPLMNEQETSHYALQTVLRATTREDFESKIGRLEYSIGKYERLIRATIPIRLFGSNDQSTSLPFPRSRISENNSSLSLYFLLKMYVISRIGICIN